MKDNLVHYLPLLILLFAGSGCMAATNKVGVSSERLINLPRGVNVGEVEKHLGIKLRHEFTVRSGTNQFRCMGLLSTEPPASFYLIFSNSNLVRITEPPAVVWTNATFRGKPWQRPVPVDPDERMSLTLLQSALSPSDIASRIEINSQRNRRHDPLNIAPAFLLTAPLWIALSPKMAAEVKQVEAWRRKYDPLLVELGASTTEVERVFGKPAASLLGKGGDIIWLFGHKNPPNVPAGVVPALVAVVFNNGSVKCILSDQFFSISWQALMP